MKKAVAYVRVSTKKQVSDGYGLDAQMEHVQDCASRDGLEIVEIFREEGISGKVDYDDRLAWLDMIEHMETNNIDVIVVPAADRMARDTYIQLRMLKELAEKGVEVHSYREPQLMDIEKNPLSKMLMTIMFSFAEYERSLIESRLRNGRKRKHKKGGVHTGRLPLGYKQEVVEGKKVVTVDEDQAELVRTIKRLKDTKLWSFKRIAEYLNDETEYRPERGAMFWDSTIRYIYNNPKYLGILQYRETDSKGRVTNEEEAVYNEQMVIL